MSRKSSLTHLICLMSADGEQISLSKSSSSSRPFSNSTSESSESMRSRRRSLSGHLRLSRLIRSAGPRGSVLHVVMVGLEIADRHFSSGND